MPTWAWILLGFVGGGAIVFIAGTILIARFFKDIFWQ